MSENIVLNYEFSFWLTFFSNEKQNQLGEYEENLKEIGSFKDSDNFWNIYQHMNRINTLSRGSEFFLFKKGIKPLWDHSENIRGGKFIIAINKDNLSSKIWEDLVINYLISPKENIKICGLVANIRTNEILVSIWTEKINNQEMFNLRNWLRNAIGLPKEINIKYKDHPNNEEIKKKQKKMEKLAERKRLDKERDFLFS